MSGLAALLPWLKALHVIAVLFWMAGLFYLPRLFVYHADAAPGTELAATFAVMERRLLHVIMTPAMAAAWVFGLALLAAGSGCAVWFQAKLALVVALSGFHGLLAFWRRGFARGHRPRSARFFRWMNELPPLLAAGVIVLVFVRPF